MFIGTYQNSIDDKGRVIIPAKFRDELGFRFVLTRGLDQCLNAYSMDEWDKFQEKLSSLPKADKDTRTFIRFFTGGAVECEVDKQGRVVIPQHLRDYAGIEKELVTVGASERVEIWGKATYDSFDEENMCGDDIARKMAERGI